MPSAHRFHRAVTMFAVLGHREKRADAADPNPYPADDVARKILLATGNFGTIFDLSAEPNLCEYRNRIRTSIVRPPVKSTSRSPRHIAFIIDGNRRWARDRDLLPSTGHEAGYRNVLAIDTACRQREIAWRSYYLLSSANMRRSSAEVEHLVDLLTRFFREWKTATDATPHLVGEIGSGALPPPLRAEAQELLNLCGTPTENANNVAFFVNYGGESGHSTAQHDTCLGHIPPVDLVVRTGGERRLSGFIPPQVAFSELTFVDEYWPEFSDIHLDVVIDEFASRDRRFGGDPAAQARVSA
ncbi:undecaprenyl diphosphate synthase family protein [Nocardia asiatica]|uniref:undecaprenyl diphosphate synthase family protein n=1 Tax=Nocardia asiatica TaxID=209252 RepID=UPI003EE18868